MMAFGYGDGGGGPNREMLENLRQLGALPGLPQVRPGRMIDFFRQMEEKAGPELPTWQGELYLELHRGTYTTQGRNKRANRRSEFLLHDAEFLAALASLVSDRSSVIGDRFTGSRPSAPGQIAGYRYPHRQLRQAWQWVCLNQFHDILPGSSIAEVYVESQAQYDEIAQIGQQVQEEALASIARHMPGHLLIVNPTSFQRTDLAWWPGQLPKGHHLVRQDSIPVSCQAGPTGTWLAAGPLLPYSVTPLFLAPADSPPLSTSGLHVTPQLLENDHLRVEFDRAGEIVAIVDKIANRQVLPNGARANQFQAFEDRPLMWDAWDIDIFYDDRMWLAEPAESVEIVEAGPLRATLLIRRRILNSEIVQEVSLAQDSRRLDFATRIDWHERHILLKVAFPVEILAPTATFEVQWGNVERPTHRNTSWDWARFESCAQKWVDLSEGDYGVSLLNDGKYGHDVRDNVLRLSLLRSPTQPDPEADQGRHEFTYSLLPHERGWGLETVAAAYALNDPLLVWEDGMRGEPGIGSEGVARSLVRVNRANVVIETVKQAEDGRGLIVRLYESQRQRGPVTVTAGFPLAAAWRTNLLEEAQAEVPVEGNSVAFPVKPYEIVTLRLAPAAET
jgi:alpha-mannosidase